jgi:hypothetical protein
MITIILKIVSGALFIGIIVVGVKAYNYLGTILYENVKRYLIWICLLSYFMGIIWGVLMMIALKGRG